MTDDLAARCATATTAAELADVVRELERKVRRAADAGVPAASVAFLAPVLADVWARYAEACEFVLEWSGDVTPGE